MALYSLQDNENERVVIGKVMVTNNIIDTVSLLQQRLKNEGLRERTIYDYVKWYEHFINHCMKKGVQDLSEISTDYIYNWLSEMEVKDTTKNIRLKSLKAGLNRLCILQDESAEVCSAIVQNITEPGYSIFPG
ncbi:hypothetical protein [Jeotgalibaca porci]|uniref:hypothetical protein n=1 Tax=Jeotgalibaca porci TaxID=1868793 RepID=UPI0035A020F7